MIETYKQFKRATDEKYISMNNEELVKIYKEAKMEYERSQSISALFVKNFPQILKVTNKYDYLDSSEKAGRVTLELVKSLDDYNFETKFITYLTTRVNNLFLWDLGNNKKKINFNNSMESLEQNKSSNEEDEYFIQVEDKRAYKNYLLSELKMDIKRAFKCELESYKGTKQYEKQKKRIEFNIKVLNILFEDPSLCASQIARKMNLFRKVEKYEDHSSAPDVEYTLKKDDSGNVIRDNHGRAILEEKITTKVRTANWNRIQEAVREIRQMFLDYNICPSM